MFSKQKLALAAMTAAVLGGAGTAQAAFEGRDATGAPSTTCTSRGPDKCTFFFDTTLGITILNNWSLGEGFWSASAAPGSAQALAASAGFAASGLTGWVLPTGFGQAPAGAQNQYLSIWESVDYSFSRLQAQFDGVQAALYWSASPFGASGNRAWVFASDEGYQGDFGASFPLFVVAVRPGDVAAAIPEPKSYALMLMGISALLLAVRKSRQA